MVTQNNQDQQSAGLTVEDMATKINSVSLSSLSNSEIFEMFSALQGSFRYADQFEKLMAHINTPAVKNAIHADAELQDKILGTANHDVDVKDMGNFGEFYKSYQRADVFSNHAPVKHKFDKKAADFINNYVSSGMDEPTVLLHFEDVANMLEKNKATLGLSPKDLKNLEKSIQSIRDDVANFVLANDLDNLALITPEDLEKSFNIAEKIANEHKAYQGAYASEMKDALTLMDNIKIVNDGSKDKFSDEDFKKELDIVTTEQAKQKCMLDPTFASKQISEQKIDFMQAKAKAIKDFVKEQAFLQAASKAGHKALDLVKDSNGVYNLKAPKKGDKAKFDKLKKEFEKDFKKSFDNLFDDTIDKKQKIEIGKTTLVASIFAKHKNNQAVGQYIDKKRGFSKVLEIAKAKTKSFAEKHPHLMNLGLGILKVGAIAAAGVYIAPAAALALSAGFSVWAINKMSTNISAKYKKGKADGKYKTKMDYIKDNKFEVAGLLMTAVGTIATAGALSGDIDGGTRSAIMMGAFTAGGVSIIANKEMNKKEKAKALATTAGILVGGVLVANLISGSAASFAEEKLNSHNVANGEGESNSTESQMQTQPINNEPSFFDKAKAWGGDVYDKIFGDGKDENPSVGDKGNQTTIFIDAEGNENTVVRDINGNETTVIKYADGRELIVVKEVNGNETTVMRDAKGQEIPVVNDPEHKETPVASEDKAQENQVKIARAEDTMSAKDLSRISIRNTMTFGKDDTAIFYNVIESGHAESLPEGMSSEEYVYKLGQLIKLAPVVHKESIDLILADLGCDDVKLTAQEISQVQESLKTIDIKGEYHGYEPTARTCNVVTGIHFNVDCESGKVNIDTSYIKGNCEPVVHDSVEKVATPVSTPEKEIVYVDKEVKVPGETVYVDREVKVPGETVYVDREVEKIVYKDCPEAKVLEPKVEENKSDEAKVVSQTSREVVSTEKTSGHVEKTVNDMNEKNGTHVVMGEQESKQAYEAAKSGNYFIMTEREFVAGEQNQDFAKAVKSGDILPDTKGNLLIKDDSQFFEKYSGDPDKNPLGIEQITDKYFENLEKPASVETPKETAHVTLTGTGDKVGFQGQTFANIVKMVNQNGRGAA